MDKKLFFINIFFVILVISILNAKGSPAGTAIVPDGSSQNEPVEVPGREGVKSPQIISKEKPKYTEEARRNKIEGIVVLSVIFRKDGTVSDIKVVRGLGYGLDEESVKAALLIKFVPGQKNGELVNVRARLEFSFALFIEFTINIDPPTITVKQGEKGEFIINAPREKKFKEKISITCADQDKFKELGIELEIPPTISDNDKNIKCKYKLSDKATPGSHRLAITGKSKSGRTQTSVLNLIIE